VLVLQSTPLLTHGVDTPFLLPLTYSPPLSSCFWLTDATLASGSQSWPPPLLRVQATSSLCYFWLELRDYAGQLYVNFLYNHLHRCIIGAYGITTCLVLHRVLNINTVAWEIYCSHAFPNKQRGKSGSSHAISMPIRSVPRPQRFDQLSSCLCR